MHPVLTPSTITSKVSSNVKVIRIQVRIQVYFEQSSTLTYIMLTLETIRITTTT